MDSKQIVGIVSIVDTRQYEERGDRWVPIPGSGEISQCDRCGRDHEVHATVELADGGCAVVGTGCMNGASLELEKAVKSGTSTAKTLARNRAILARELEKIEAARAIIAEVDALEVPAVTFTTQQNRTVGRNHPDGEWTETRIAHCAEHTAPRYNDWQTDEELAEFARGAWRLAQLRARGLNRSLYSLESDAEATRTLIARAERKLEKLAA